MCGTEQVNQQHRVLFTLYSGHDVYTDVRAAQLTCGLKKTSKLDLSGHKKIKNICGRPKHHLANKILAISKHSALLEWEILLM